MQKNAKTSAPELPFYNAYPSARKWICTCIYIWGRSLFVFGSFWCQALISTSSRTGWLQERQRGGRGGGSRRNLFVLMIKIKLRIICFPALKISPSIALASKVERGGAREESHALAPPGLSGCVFRHSEAVQRHHCQDKRNSTSMVCRHSTDQFVTLALKIELWTKSAWSQSHTSDTLDESVRWKWLIRFLFPP